VHLIGYLALIFAKPANSLLYNHTQKKNLTGLKSEGSLAWKHTRDPHSDGHTAQKASELPKPLWLIKFQTRYKMIVLALYSLCWLVS